MSDLIVVDRCELYYQAFLECGRNAFWDQTGIPYFWNSAFNDEEAFRRWWVDQEAKLDPDNPVAPEWAEHDTVMRMVRIMQGHGRALLFGLPEQDRLRWERKLEKSPGGCLMRQPF
jgi:hypothetical protein